MVALRNVRLELDEDQIERVRNRHFFREEDRDDLRRMAKELGEAASPAFFALYGDELEQKGIHLGLGKAALCFATLGAGTDRLAEALGQEGCLMEAYMLECLSLPMLSLLYEKGRGALEGNGQFVASYDFLAGRESEFEGWMQRAGFPARWQKGYLVPQKSALYAAPLSDAPQGEGTKIGSICNACHSGHKGCGQKDCMGL